MDFHLDILLPTRFAPEELESTRGYGSLGWGNLSSRPSGIRPGVIIIFCRDAIYRLLMAHPLDEHIDFNEYHVYNFNGSLVDDLEMAVNKGKDISTNPIIKFINNPRLAKITGGWVILSLDDEKNRSD